jgi:hypothetical protein
VASVGDPWLPGPGSFTPCPAGSLRRGVTDFAGVTPSSNGLPTTEHCGGITCSHNHDDRIALVLCLTELHFGSSCRGYIMPECQGQAKPQLGFSGEGEVAPSKVGWAGTLSVTSMSPLVSNRAALMKDPPTSKARPEALAAPRDTGDGMGVLLFVR